MDAVLNSQICDIEGSEKTFTTVLLFDGKPLAQKFKFPAKYNSVASWKDIKKKLRTSARCQNCDIMQPKGIQKNKKTINVSIRCSQRKKNKTTPSTPNTVPTPTVEGELTDTEGNDSHIVEPDLPMQVSQLTVVDENPVAIRSKKTRKSSTKRVSEDCNFKISAKFILSEKRWEVINCVFEHQGHFPIDRFSEELSEEMRERGDIPAKAHGSFIDTCDYTILQEDGKRNIDQSANCQLD